MLETFREHSKGWLAKLLLALITIPFALWGIDSYLHQAGTSVAVAEVDGESISVQEFGNALQNVRYRLQAEGKADPALLDDPAFKHSLLDELIQQRLLAAEAREARFALSDQSLSEQIFALPEFQQDGKFSQERYDSVLSQNRMSPTQFEARMRSDLIMQQLRDGIAAAGFTPQALFDATMAIERQQREVSVAKVAAEQFLAQASVTPEQVKAYYDQNQERFRIPEQVKIQFVLYSANALIADMQVSDEEVKKYYDENAAQFQGDEQRGASHILIGFGGNTDAASKQAAREKALRVLEEVRQHPDDFAALAKKYSDDPGSRENGGDLGLFGRGTMVKPFEDAVFSLAPGAVSDLVETEFGYHIIKLTDIQGQSQGFEQHKVNIRAELLYQKALAKFAERAENFSNLVYEQYDSLQPAADALGLQIQNSPWMSRADALKFFKNDKLVNAIFSSEVLKDGRNTEAIEAAPNTLVAARVAEYKPAEPRKFEEVSESIEAFLRQEQGAKLAIAQGQKLLADLQAGKAADGITWSEPVVVDRKNAQGLGADVVQQAFRVAADSVPAYAGMEDPLRGYTLVRVGKVEATAVTDEDINALARNELQIAFADELLAAYLASLKGKAEITVNERLLGGSNP